MKNKILSRLFLLFLSLNISAGFLYSQNPIIFRKLFLSPEKTNTQSVPFLRATGGTITIENGFKIHQFNQNDNFRVVSAATGSNSIVNRLLVAGGGSGGDGGGTAGGGGGGGQMISGTITISGVENDSVRVGNGGVVVSFAGVNGENSFFKTDTAKGGGGGGGYSTSSNGNNGYTGGGGGAYSVGGSPGNGGTGTSGFNGGNALLYPLGAGGGAGISQSGGTPTLSIAGNGGYGLPSSITGTLVYYGGGGGGGSNSDAGQTGGFGQDGGGNGSIRIGVRAATSGLNGTGGGGGGASEGPAGDGGDGLLWLSYPSLPFDTTNVLIFAADTIFTRYGGLAPYSVSTGSYIIAGHINNDDPSDFGSAEMYFYTTANLVNYTSLSHTFAATSSLTAATIAPSVYKKNNGEWLVMYYEVIQDLAGAQLTFMTSTNNCVSFSQPTVAVANSTNYINAIDNRIFKITFGANSGRLILPYEINFDGNILGGDYYGLTLYSDDDGVTWATASQSITSPDGQCLESCIAEMNGMLFRYFRSQDGPVYYCTNSGDGLNWSSPINTGLYAVPTGSTNLEKPNTTSVKKLNDGTFIAVYNSGTREHLNIALSYNGFSWTNIFNIDNVPGEMIFAGAITEKDEYVYFNITSSRNTFTLYDARVIKLKISTYK